MIYSVNVAITHCLWLSRLPDTSQSHFGFSVFVGSTGVAVVSGSNMSWFAAGASLTCVGVSDVEATGPAIIVIEVLAEAMLGIVVAIVVALSTVVLTSSSATATTATTWVGWRGCLLKLTDLFLESCNLDGCCRVVAIVALLYTVGLVFNEGRGLVGLCRIGS